MSSLDKRRKKQDLEARATAAEESAQRNDNGSRTALEATINAAELYMQALRLADDVQDKRRLDAKTKDLIAKAERLKNVGDSHNVLDGTMKSRGRVDHPSSTRNLTTRENIILLEGSKLNGAVFKPWATTPKDEEFECQNGQEQWLDKFEYSLSETQLKHFAGWKRPREALSLIKIAKNGQVLPNEATMITLGTWDMVQDVAPDCSVIASFCVGTARAEKGHRRLFGSIVHPYDHKHERPRMSPNGRYVMRFYFNGCWRQVEVDDLLPTSNSSRVLHVIDRSHPGLIWPTIVEKAYLKVRGGYDFPGSNSGTDLAVLCGWIPQQIFLHDEDVDPCGLWDELLPEFTRGEVLCTLGTGRLGRREQQQLGLGAEHDYAILDMKQTEDRREMLIKNPWADGDIWKGATKFKPHPGHENDAHQSTKDEESTKEMKPGTFWMDFNHVFQYFENLYVNWDPCLFNYREDMHFSWNLSEVTRPGNLFIDHPQFAIKAKKSGDLWILLNRHFRTGDYSAENHGKNGYISLYLFDNHGGIVFSSENATIRGPFVDSPNTLLRFQAQAQQAYTAVAVSQDLPVGKHNFTISAFCNSSVELTQANQIYNHSQTLTGAWTRSTAGGSADTAKYLENPQYTISATHETRAALVLRTLPPPRDPTETPSSSTSTHTDIPIKLLLASSDGRRITKLRPRDITAQSHSGAYKRGSAVLETTLPRGTYTLIASTFEPNQLCKFQLDFHFHSTAIPQQAGPRAGVNITPLPAEGSGRLSIQCPSAIFAPSTRKLTAQLTVPRVTKALFKATLASASTSPSARLTPSTHPFKLTLSQSRGPYALTLGTSSTAETEFHPLTSGLRIEDVDLTGSMASTAIGGLWLTIERARRGSAGVNVNGDGEGATVAVAIEVLSEEGIAVGGWGVVEGEF